MSRTVDVTRGVRDGRVSAMWSRQHDKRHLSLDSLYADMREKMVASQDVVVELSTIKPFYGDGEFMLDVPKYSKALIPTHWSFSQLCKEISVPAEFMRRLPPKLVVENMSYALSTSSGKAKVLARKSDNNDVADVFTAITGPDYGRIWDAEMVFMFVEALKSSDRKWKVPGVLDWQTKQYDPWVPVTEETTTLFSSDRSCFAFVVDDIDGIEIGKLANGDPDIVFPGVYASNSEVGERKIEFGMYISRAICANRTVWGIEWQTHFSIRHTKNAPARFTNTVEALKVPETIDKDGIVMRFKAAKELVIAKTDEDAHKFIVDLGYGIKEAKMITSLVLVEEQRPLRTLLDAVNGITAYAKGETHVGERFKHELIARKLMASA